MNRLQLGTLASLLLTLLVSTTLSGQNNDWRRDSIYFDQGIPETPDYENQIRIYFEEYDANGRPLEIIAQKPNAQEEWINWRRRTFTYTDNLLTEVLIQFWDADAEEWQDSKQKLFVYDGQGNLTSRQVNKAPSLGEPLQNNRLWTYTLNGNGEQIELLFQKWDGAAWENATQQEWTYDLDGRISQQVQHIWDGNTWTNGRRRIWVYDGVSGMVEQVIAQYWNIGSGDWLNDEQVMYENNGVGLITGIRKQEWGIPQGWQNTKQQLFSYDGTHLEFERLQMWNGSSWDNLFRLQFFYDGSALNTFGAEWDTDQNEWTPHVRYQMIFDDGRIQTEQGWQFWNENQETWENDDITFRRRHFWSEPSVNTFTPPLLEHCAVPNPFVAGSSFTCESLQPNQTYQLTLTNLMGQEMSSQIISGPGPYYLLTGGLNGFFVLSIRQGNQLIYTQKLIITQ
jgi:hypothetical protein